MGLVERRGKCVFERATVINWYDDTGARVVRVKLY